jgi:hypothetical protein
MAERSPIRTPVRSVEGVLYDARELECAQFTMIDEAEYAAKCINSHADLTQQVSRLTKALERADEELGISTIHSNPRLAFNHLEKAREIIQEALKGGANAE